MNASRETRDEKRKKEYGELHMLQERNLYQGRKTVEDIILHYTLSGIEEII